jgi:hypothetical protein
MRKQSVNLWAVLVCVVIGQIIPAIWYYIFAEQWSSLNGFDKPAMDAANSSIPYLASIVSSGFMAYTIGWLFTKIPIKSGYTGFLIGLLFGIVFVLFEIVVKDMFSRRPLELSLIDGGVSVIIYSITGFILGLWRTYEK